MLFLWDQLSKYYLICFPWWGVRAKQAQSWAWFTSSPPEHTPPTALPLPPPTLCLPACQLPSVVPFAHSQLQASFRATPTRWAICQLVYIKLPHSNSSESPICSQEHSSSKDHPPSASRRPAQEGPSEYWALEAGFPILPSRAWPERAGGRHIQSPGWTKGPILHLIRNSSSLWEPLWVKAHPDTPSPGETLGWGHTALDTRTEFEETSSREDLECLCLTKHHIIIATIAFGVLAAPDSLSHQMFSAALNAGTIIITMFLDMDTGA